MSDAIYSEQAQQELLEKRIEKNRERSGNILDTIQNDGQMINDFILNLGKTSPINFTSNGDVKLNIDNGEHHEYKLHPHAIVQAGDKLGINSTFIKDLAYSNQEWKKQLISTNLNTFVQNTDRSRVLVRSVGNEVRGILSDAYKRLDSGVLYNTFINQSNQLGMQVIDAHYDGLQGFLESVYPRVFKISTARNGEMFFGFGIRMRNSDFGTSPFELSAFCFQVVCYNGMVSTSAIKAIHLGSRLPDNLQLAEDTMQADTNYKNLAARDAIHQLMDRNSIEKRISEIQDASDTIVDINGRLKDLTRSNKMSKGEVEQLKSVITNNRYEDGMQGENTLLKLSQAVGRVGVLSENQTRKRELDELADSLLKKS
jgi:hypothetical protein